MWNVKRVFNPDADWLVFVLIETLWNVKIFKSLYIISFPRINRNIVECKVASSSNNTAKMLVLIETLWNVKIENYDRMEDWTEY